MVRPLLDATTVDAPRTVLDGTARLPVADRPLATPTAPLRLCPPVPAPIDLEVALEAPLVVETTMIDLLPEATMTEPRSVETLTMTAVAPLFRRPLTTVAMDEATTETSA